MKILKNFGFQSINWSSDGLAQEDRFSAFDSLLTKSLIRVTTIVDNHTDFWCHFSSISSGQFSVTDITGSKKHSKRTTHDLATSSGDAFHLVYAGIDWLFQNDTGQEISIPAGSLLLIDTRKRYSSFLPEGFLNRTITLPREWLITWVPEPEKIIERNLCEVSGWGKVISSYLIQISPTYLSGVEFKSSLILDQLGSMLSFLYNDIVCNNVSSGRFSSDRKYQRILDYLHLRHMNLLLNANDLAQDIGMSTRTLHRILANRGTSYSQVLLTYRANTALRMLKEKKYDELTISDIAKRAGFIDLSHFNRVCKKYFGESPGQIRKNHGNQDSGR